MIRGSLDFSTGKEKAAAFMRRIEQSNLRYYEDIIYHRLQKRKLSEIGLAGGKSYRAQIMPKEKLLGSERQGRAPGKQPALI